MTRILSIVSADDLRILNEMQLIPGSKSRYDMWSGGLYWPDEFPETDKPEGKLIWRDYLPRYLIGCRAAITLGEPEDHWRLLWNHVAQQAPHWPGLLSERCNSKMRKRLLAALRRADCQMDEWDKE